MYFWLKEEFRNAEAKAKFEAGLADLFEIPSVAGGFWGVSAATEERPVTEKSWDYAITVHFKSLADHDAYQVHPKHDVFVEAFRAWWDRVQVMDMEAP